MITRRNFIYTSSAAFFMAGVPVAAGSIDYPFTLGVASGCPQDHSVILWTRLAPKPLAGGGMPAGNVSVRYRVCTDSEMKTTIKDELVDTNDRKAHAVHVTLNDLKPGHDYWYQFYFGDYESPVGRTRTSDRNAASASFALASCQSWESGYYAAFGEIARWAPDCVIHVGDYIYEGGPSELGEHKREYNGQTLTSRTVRQNNSAEITTLWDYRNRYALYRSDAQLQAAHQASPWLISMDDHEIDNNWAGYTPQDPHKQTQMEFAVRRLAALQAYYEHMPIPEPPRLKGLKSNLQMYGLYRFGPAQVHLLDTRQFRSDQVCGRDHTGEFPCEALTDSKRTMTGAEQEKWLLKNLDKSQAQFNVLAQQTWFAPYRYSEDPKEQQWNLDQWDGYPAQRERLLDKMAQVSNPVVLSGDWHCAHAAQLKRNHLDKKNSVIGHEFATTSISSNCPWSQKVAQAAEFNPHSLYNNGEKRGYLRCEVSRNNWRSTYRTVNDPYDPQSPLSTDQQIDTVDV